MSPLNIDIVEVLDLRVTSFFIDYKIPLCFCYILIKLTNVKNIVLQNNRCEYSIIFATKRAHPNLIIFMSISKLSLQGSWHVFISYLELYGRTSCVISLAHKFFICSPIELILNTNLFQNRTYIIRMYLYTDSTHVQYQAALNFVPLTYLISSKQIISGPTI